jgi:phenylalanine-4-hydroxylase
MPLSHAADLLDLNPNIQRFLVPQRYDEYTPVEHDTWQRLMAQLLPFWQECAHHDFVAGLAKTGIDLNQLPCIDYIDERLQAFGWRAVTVDGYVPPEVFMGLQSRKIIPVARDMRKPENINYTPAPDIVHEAAAHVPLLVNPDYSNIVQRFGELSLKAGYSAYDEDVYEIVRRLSNIKESPTATADEIAEAERALEKITAEAPHHETSVGKQLARLYWWTVEYGLIGDDEDDLKIYGAGLLSSVGESQKALLGPANGGPELIPLSADAFDMDFDITRPQPQLYVTPTFAYIGEVLEAFAQKHNLV